MCSDDSIIGWCFGLVAIAIITFFSYIFFTDEYTVIQERECIERISDNKCLKYETTYFCKKENGETLRICKDPAECSDFCNKAREQ